MGYEYLDPGDKDIVWLRVIKTLHWYNRPSYIRDDIPVGAITWTLKHQWDRLSKNNCVIPESNRYGNNYSSSCFELIHQHADVVIPLNTEGLLVQYNNIAEQIHPKKKELRLILQS